MWIEIGQVPVVEKGLFFCNNFRREACPGLSASFGDVGVIGVEGVCDIEHVRREVFKRDVITLNDDARAFWQTFKEVVGIRHGWLPLG